MNQLLVTLKSNPARTWCKKIVCSPSCFQPFCGSVRCFQPAGATSDKPDISTAAWLTACYGADTQILGPSVVGIEALGVRRDPSVFLTGFPLFPTVEITAVVRGMRVPRQQWRVGEFFCSWEKGAEMKTKNYRWGEKVFQDGASQTQSLAGW